MENELYRKVIVCAREAEDGETPTAVVVTEERNLFVVWVTSFGGGTELMNTYPRCRFSREHAIEAAVDMGRQMGVK